MCSNRSPVCGFTITVGLRENVFRKSFTVLAVAVFAALGVIAILQHNSKFPKNYIQEKLPLVVFVIDLAPCVTFVSFNNFP